MHRRTFARVAPLRAKMLFYILAAVALFLVWRLYKIQVIQGPALAREALAQSSDTVDVFARRGSILDRNGNVLVRSLPSNSIYIVPHDITDTALTTSKLTAILGTLDPDVIAAMRDKRLWFYWVARKVRYEVAQRVRALDLPGVALKQEDTGRRIDTAGTLASTLLGFVGTDENGLDGLEYEFDNLLKGRTGRVTLQTDEFGRPIPFGHDTIVKAAQPGVNVELTIDSYLQFVTQQALSEQMQVFHATNATAIVMDPQTGGVLAMVNLPSFDPDHFWRYSDSQRRDRAVQSAYEPGSTYKLVTAAAALTSGRVTPTSLFPAASTLAIGGHVIHNAADGFTAGKSGTETLGQIIQYSLNVGAAEVGMRTGSKAFYSMEQKAGFGSPTNIELPGENPGIVPPPAQWSETSLPTMAFGQGVAVTPIALTRFYCAIADNGILLRPRIVRAFLDAKGRTIYRYKPEIERRIFSRKVAAILRGYLRSVVVAGTGQGTANVPGYRTSGKTGTAQMVEDGQYQPGAYVASFIGMIPANHPRFVIYVKVTRPIGSYYGTTVAAPAFAKIARAAMLHAGILPRPQHG